MDIEVEKKIQETIEYLKTVSRNELDLQHMDPIAKMMLVAVLHESQKIKDYVDGVGDKIIEKFCETFIPRREIQATPALSIIEAKFKAKKDTEAVHIGSGASFSYKLDNKQQLSFLPIFNTLTIPYQNICTLSQNRLKIGDDVYSVSVDKPNCMWLGIETKVEFETLKDLSILIKGTKGVVPEHIYVGLEDYELEFADMARLEEIEMVEPFDAQQSSNQYFSIIENWKDVLLNIEDKALLYITDKIVDRDVFKQRSFPKVFQHWLESEQLDYFNENIIWLRLEFPEDYVIPEECSVIINAMPIVNVEINNVTLTQTTPIAKLQKQDNSYFLQVIETSTSSYKQGFNMANDEIIIRDFDASCYHEGNLYRDVRNLYNRFIDDYYAFIEYNGIKDGETIKQLRDVINRIGKGVGISNSKYNFDSGTYVMKNMNQYQQSSSIKVSFSTTLGKLGNIPSEGETMENKKLPLIEKDVNIIVAGTGGTNKATIDERYELLRYYSLTNDRLYTKKDLEAYLRKEIIAEFGKEEYKRIFIKIKIEGAAGETKLQRGLYITIEFKDKKNYEKAMDSSLTQRLSQKIRNKSCISMPINLSLLNIED